MVRFLLAVWLSLILALPVCAESRELRVPLRGGKLRTAELAERVETELALPIHVDALPGPTIDLHGVKEPIYLAVLEDSLGEAFDLDVEGEQLVVEVDLDELPPKMRASKAMVRAAVERHRGVLQGRDRSFGLHLATEVDAARPLVILVHGIDSNTDCWNAWVPLLSGRGYQVAVFSYPNDQSIADSGRFLGAEIDALVDRHASLRMHLVTHSMGGLVARWYIEGPEYAGGVDRLILLAPPNQGSCYARGRFLAEGYEHLALWRCEEQWSWNWCVADGLGEAGHDLRPGSDFLKQLNARSRRAGVRYTIVAGNRNCGWRYTARAIDAAADVLPEWRWLNCMRSSLTCSAERLRVRTGGSDGLVSLESVRLAGVRDIVIVPADHTTIFAAHGDQPPAAWGVVSNRLASR